MAPDPGVRRAVHAALLGPVVDAAVHRRTLWVTPAVEAVAVFVPPGAPETLPGAGVDTAALVALLGPDRAGVVMALFDRFEQARPRTPHHYLSLLATSATQRGHGHGARLLHDVVRRPELAGTPAYLESSNPANDRRYASLGFEPLGDVPQVDGCPPITTMWRPADETA
jgi:GNAT superfamily N-acetyltransferase